MSAALRRGAAVAALLSACSIDLSNKLGCNSNNDCIPGYTCVAKTCMPVTDGGGGSGGNSFDGGIDAPPPRTCPASPVTSCPGDTGCQEIVCGGRVWQNALLPSLLVPFRILDPDDLFSDGHRNAIRAAATAWTSATSGFVKFQECSACVGQFVSVVPGDGDGVANPGDAEQRLPMAVAASGRLSPHRIAHQWGHVLGLAHTYQRADRDRYARFNPALWCAPGGSGLPPRCASAAAGPPGSGLPDVTTGTFGVYDETSKMNALASDGVCGAGGPDEDSGEPTISDVSAVAELFFATAGSWSPFRPIARSPSATEPLDYQLAGGVDPIGAPAIAERDYASPEIFVRGTDDRVYATARADAAASTAGWLDWTPVADDVDADPAAVFAVNDDDGTLFLAVRSRLDGNIQLRARRAGTWGPATSLGAPPVGAASAPALASESPYVLAVLVRGGDGLIYRLPCTDATANCTASAAGPTSWSPLPPPSSGVFVGKPAAVWMRDVTGLTVAAIRDDRVALVITRVDAGGSGWLAAANVTANLAPDDPNPGVEITMTPTPGDVAFYARDAQGLMTIDTLQSKYFPIGGVLASLPAAVAVYHGAVRTDVAAIIDDHGRRGVWWRYNDVAYTPPAATATGTCAPSGP